MPLRYTESAANASFMVGYIVNTELNPEILKTSLTISPKEQKTKFTEAPLPSFSIVKTPLNPAELIYSTFSILPITAGTPV